MFTDLSRSILIKTYYAHLRDSAINSRKVCLDGEQHYARTASHIR